MKAVLCCPFALRSHCHWLFRRPQVYARYVAISNLIPENQAARQQSLRVLTGPLSPTAGVYPTVQEPPVPPAMTGWAGPGFPVRQCSHGPLSPQGESNAQEYASRTERKKQKSPLDQILTPNAPKPFPSCRFLGENNKGGGTFSVEVVSKKPGQGVVRGLQGSPQGSLSWKKRGWSQ